jgi:predicted transcriptional regulator
MATKVTIELDDKVRRALKQASLNLGRPEREITEQALRQYLRLEVLDRIGRAGRHMSETETSRLANEEVHAARRERRRDSRTG